MCIILRARLIGRVVVTHVCEYDDVEVYVSRKTDERNCSVDSLVWKMLRQRER